MLNRILVIFFILMLLNACQSPDQENIAFNEDSTRVTLAETDEGNLLVIDYVIINRTKEKRGPFYTKIIFHEKTIANIVGKTESSLYKDMGVKESIITLNKNESIRSGENFKIGKYYTEFILRGLIEKTNAIEIQLINVESEEIVVSHWIHEFAYIADK